MCLIRSAIESVGFCSTEQVKRKYVVPEIGPLGTKNPAERDFKQGLVAKIPTYLSSIIEIFLALSSRKECTGLSREGLEKGRIFS